MPALKLADILHLLVTIDNLKQNYEKKSTEKSTDKQTNKQTKQLSRWVKKSSNNPRNLFQLKNMAVLF